MALTRYIPTRRPGLLACVFPEGRKESRAAPMMLEAQQPTSQAQRGWFFLTPSPTRIVKRIETSPEGVFRRAAVDGL